MYDLNPTIKHAVMRVFAIFAISSVLLFGSARAHADRSATQFLLANEETIAAACGGPLPVEGIICRGDVSAPDSVRESVVRRIAEYVSNGLPSGKPLRYTYLDIKKKNEPEGIEYYVGTPAFESFSRTGEPIPYAGPVEMFWRAVDSSIPTLGGPIAKR